MDLHSCIDDSDALRSLFRSPSQRAVDKEIDHIDDAAARMIGASPLFIFATSDGERVDISPRGGTPGFVKVVDQRHVAFGILPATTASTRIETSYSSHRLQCCS